MSDAHDPNLTADIPTVPDDSLDAALAAGFGKPADGPGSVLSALRSSLGPLRPVLLQEAEGESAHVVQPKSDAMPAPDQSGDRYQLFGEIARGGMGAVIRGRDVDLGRDLAVKVLLEKHADRPEVARRFVEEAQIGGQLQHPGVVPVYDIGRFGDRSFFTMKLAKVLVEGGIVDEERASRQHRQPDDVTTIRTARSTGSAGGYGSDTEAGSLLGTPAYMPPEQANGDVASLDRRADVFGLGAILCEILTGKPPYVGRSSEEVRRKSANGDLAEAKARLDACGADAELAALTIACLSPEEADRPSDALAVKDALTAYLDGVQDRLHKAELAEAEAKTRAVEESKRRRLTLVLAGVVLLAVTLGAGGGLWVKADRDARQAQLARDVNDALNRATVLREQAKAATVGSAALFAQAREQAQRALALVENGPADAVIKDQVEQMQGELDEEDRDRQLIAALEAARLVQAETLSENRFAMERAVPLFREAFRAYGLPVGEGEPSAAAVRLQTRPAPVREAVSAALDEWIDLAANPRFQITESHLDWLRSVAAAAEPDEGWTRDFRTAVAEKQPTKRRAALEQLAKVADVRKLPVRALTRLAQRLRSVQAEASAIQLLRRTRQQYPADFWVNEELGQALLQAKPPVLEEAVRYLTAAVAVRPDSPGAHLNLGNATKAEGQLDEAIACYRKAIEINPKFALAHTYLGNVLRAKGQLGEAIACFHKAIDLDPKYAAAHNHLGLALVAAGHLDQAIVEYKTAVELDPKIGHVNLGNALRAQGRLDEAIGEYRKAIERNPKLVPAHNMLGAALQAKGQMDEAIACYHKVIALAPKNANAPSQIARAMRVCAVRDKLTAFQKGGFTPATTDDRLGLADWCRVKKLHRTAVGLYTDAFAANPEEGNDLQAGYRQNAACSASLAAAGQGEDAAKLDAKERTRLRKQALDWLHADLALRSEQLERDEPAKRATAQQALRHWQQDIDLAGIRDPADLAKLPAEERAAFARLWADVEALLKKAEDTPL